MDFSSLSAVSRRGLLQGAAAVAGTAVITLREADAAAAAAPARTGVFGYGVASGDPLADRVVIWTRATPPLPGRGAPAATPGSGLGRPLMVHWEVARDPAMKHVVRRGHVKTSAASDHTVKVDVDGLDPYTRYWYRFSARGEHSPVGRTQTAPDVAGQTHALRLALVSCSNYTGGYFGAYRAIARRDDLDAVLHVGDYIYEYGNDEDRYGPDTLRGVRDMVPEGETVTLTDYRLRHALQKSDPDQQAAHRAHPWITIFDDHEITNDAWADGAQNHQPGEGDYAARKASALQAYLEWMPVRLPDQSVPHEGTRFFRRFTFGDLAQLSIADTRQNRSRQAGGFVPLGNPVTDAVMEDPARVLTEPAQTRWLKDGVRRAAEPWHLIGQQIVMTRVLWPGAALGAPGATIVNADQWDGYRPAQRDMIDSLRQARPDAVVLTGDIHSSWANELVADRGERSAGVEFVCPSVTSDGFFEIAGGTADPVGGVTRARQLTGALQAMNPHVKHLDGIGHGWVCVDVTPERVQADWHLTPLPTAAVPDPRVVRGIEPVHAFSYVTRRGQRTLQAAAGPVGRRADTPR